MATALLDILVFTHIENNRHFQLPEILSQKTPNINKHRGLNVTLKQRVLLPTEMFFYPFLKLIFTSDFRGRFRIKLAI